MTDRNYRNVFLEIGKTQEEINKRVEDTFSQNQQEIVKGNEFKYKFKVVEIFEKIVQSATYTIRKE